MRGIWHGAPFHDVVNGRWILSFEVDETPVIYDSTSGGDLDIDVKRYREKRSLNANAYFHVLVDKIAKALKLSAVETKNMMLERYGTVDVEIGKILLRADIPYLKLTEIHLRATSEYEIHGETIMRAYIAVKGSHLYDSKEMSDLIDGTVEEAKSLGIETATPEEIERMKSLWKNAKEN